MKNIYFINRYNMMECTFAINTKGQNTVLTDERALAIRISNLLLNRKTGLPNNSKAFFDIKSYIQEFAGSGNIKALEEDIKAHIRQYIPSDMEMLVEITKDGNVNDLRKTLYITITLGNTDTATSLIFKANSTADGLKLDKVVSL